MKFLVSLIVLGLSGSVIGGGKTNCGSLQANYLVLLQTCEYLMNETANFVNYTVYSYPYVGSSYIKTLICDLNINIRSMASGTSHFSGVNSDYILGIFNGSTNPPFIAPLDCIEAELLSFYSYIQNLTYNVAPELEASVISSPINETTPCQTVVQIQGQYFANTEVFKAIGIKVTNAALLAFASIGLSDLFTKQIYEAQECTKVETINILQEFYNINSTIANDFVANQSITVPRPLSCVQSLMTSYINGQNSIYDVINNNINTTSVPASCEPLYTDFRNFKNTWISYIEQLRYYAISFSADNPVLTPFFVADLLCELDVMISFAANATSFLSGIGSDTIYAILKGEVLAPFPSPLDCIENDLIFVNNLITDLINNVIPGFQNLAFNSTSDTSTCNTTYTALTGYVVQLVDLLNQKGYFVTSGTALFTSTNFGGLFLESFASILDCLPDLVGKYVGAALNTDGSAVTAYVKGNRNSLPYPFNCAKLLIDITDSLMNQALVNFVTESPNNLVLPKIPVFRG